MRNMLVAGAAGAVIVLTPVTALAATHVVRGFDSLHNVPTYERHVSRLYDPLRVENGSALLESDFGLVQQQNV